MFDKIDAVVRRYETLTERLGDPSLYDRTDEMRQINQERSSIEPLVIKYRETIVQRYKDTAFWKALEATKIYKWYLRYEELKN